MGLAVGGATGQDSVVARAWVLSGQKPMTEEPARATTKRRCWRCCSTGAATRSATGSALRCQGSYNRTSTLERRRPLMQSWADYVTGQAGDNVVPFKAASQTA